MILVIDNYDSFTYNLVQYLGELGQEIQVFRNDAISLEQIRPARPRSHPDLTRSGNPRPGRYIQPGDRRIWQDGAAFGRVPGAPMHRPGLRRQSGAGAATDARQGFTGLSSRGRPLFWHPQPLRGHPLPFVDRRRTAARSVSHQRFHKRRRNYGAAPQAVPHFRCAVPP